MRLNWATTADFGVYAKLIFDLKAIDSEAENHCVHVGSATVLFMGISVRRARHEKPTEVEYVQQSLNSLSLASADLDRKKAHHLRLVHGPYKRKNVFIKLFRVPDSPTTTNDQLSVHRNICMAVEGLYSLMLSAFYPRLEGMYDNTCVYGIPLTVFMWRGACSHSCLRE